MVAEDFRTQVIPKVCGPMVEGSCASILLENILMPRNQLNINKLEIDLNLANAKALRNALDERIRYTERKGASE